MKLVDKKGFLFNRLHVIDGFVLSVVVIGLIIFAASYLKGGEIEVKPPGEKVMVKATFLSFPYREEFLETYQVGDILAKDKSFLNGKVTDTKILDTYISLVDNQGNEVTDVHPFLKRALVTVEVELEREEPIIFFKGAEMVVNENHFLTTMTSDLSFKLESYEIIGE